MKKLITYSLTAVFLLMVSCHARKKVTESYALRDKTNITRADSSRLITDHQVTGTDSTRVQIADSSHKTQKEKININFHLKKSPNRFSLDSAGTADQDVLNRMIMQALANSDSVQVHIEREQESRHTRKSTTQRAVKTTAAAHQVQTQSARTDTHQNITQKATVKQVETKPSYAWAPWLGAILLLLLVAFVIHDHLFKNKDANH